MQKTFIIILNLKILKSDTPTYNGGIFFVFRNFITHQTIIIFNKLLFFEEIFIGDRIRDIVYLKDEKMIIMSLEFSGSIGIIQNIK